MHKHPLSTRIILLVFGLSFAGLLQAASPDRSPGSYIPVLKNATPREFTATQWVKSSTGTGLRVEVGADQAWQAIDQALDRMGVKAIDKNAASREWLTDWVVWKYDSKSNTARSKPGLSFSNRELERHRFLFSVRAGDSPEGSIISVVDRQRQVEVDITPDSAYAWLEWKDSASQQGAADTFLERLQLPIESALATQFVVTEAPVRIITSGAGDRGTRGAVTPDTVIITGKASLDGKREVIVIDKGSMAKAAPMPEKVRPLPGKDADEAAAIADSGKSATKAVPSIASMPTPKPAATPAPEPEIATTPAITPAANGLLVRAAPDHAWSALLQALDDLGISRQQEAADKYRFATDWVAADYDKKNQLLKMRSGEDPGWAFSVFGKGIERHRFVLELVSANQGTRSVIYAQHAGYQELVDQTPDTSETQLVWENRETSDAIALSLLRRLRIVVQ